MSIKRTLLILVAIAGATVAYCASLNTKSWDEEVKLNDGRVIIVTQKRKFDGGIARETWLTIRLSEFSPRDIVWHEHLNPYVVNVYKNKLYVVGNFPTDLEFRLYGKPMPRYVGFSFESGEWKRIAAENIPEAIYNTNMVIDGAYKVTTKRLTLEMKASEEFNGDGRLRAAPHLLRLDPSHKGNYD